VPFFLTRRALSQDYATTFYGKLPLNQSVTRSGRPRTRIGSLSAANDGEPVLLQARVHTSRAQGNKMVFFLLRQRTDTVQALLFVSPEKVSKQMAKWAAGLGMESIVLIEGVVKKAPEPIKSASVSDVEISISQVCLCVVEGGFSADEAQIHLVSGLAEVLPFTLDDAMRASEDVESSDVQMNRVLLDTRLNNRVIDLRVGYRGWACRAHLTDFPDTNKSEHLQAPSRHRRPFPRVS
jgi:aspartyl/asparaginyl-tRNA synthetase